MEIVITIKHRLLILHPLNSQAFYGSVRNKIFLHDPLVKKAHKKNKKQEMRTNKRSTLNRRYPLSGPPSWVIASTKRSWSSEVHRKRCFPLPPDVVVLFTVAPPKTPTFANCSALCGLWGTKPTVENFFAWYMLIRLQVITCAILSTIYY